MAIGVWVLLADAFDNKAVVWQGPQYAEVAVACVLIISIVLMTVLPGDDD